MSLAPINPNSGMTPVYRAQAPSGPAAGPAPLNFAPADSFQAGSAPAGPQAAAKPEQQTKQYANGAMVAYTKDQHGLSCRTALPGGPGMLLPVPLIIDVVNQGGQVQTQAYRVDGAEPQALSCGVGPDGSVYVQMEPNAPLAVLNDDFSYGLSTMPAGDKEHGYTRGMMETIEPDNSRAMVFNERTSGLQKDGTRHREFTEVRQNQAGLTAADVSENSPYGHKQAPNANGSWTDSFTNLTSTQRRDEKPRQVQPQADGSLTVSPGSFKDHMLGALKGRSGWFSSPLLDMRRQSGQTDRIMPFSNQIAAYPMAVFPQTLGAGAGTPQGYPPAAAGPQGYPPAAAGPQGYPPAEANPGLASTPPGAAAQQTPAPDAAEVKAQARDAANNAFLAKFDRMGFLTKADPRYGSPSPHELAGKEVALLYDDPQQGLIEVRGRLRPEGDDGSAMFRVDGYPQEFNNNFLPAMAYRP